MIQWCLAELSELIKQVRPFLAKVSKAKGGKLVRHLIDQFLQTGGDIEEQVNLVLVPFAPFFVSNH